MKSVQLYTPELTVSRLCLGTVGFGSTMDERTSFAYMDRFAELGGNFLDTARVYADWIPDAPRQASEKCIGAWLRARSMQASCIVATKGGQPPLDGSGRPTLSLTELTRQADESRRNLGLDTLPLYYLHRDDPRIPIPQIMDAMFTLQDRGVIRHVGLSNWTLDRILAAGGYARLNGREALTVLSNQWSLARPVPGAGDPTLVHMDDGLLALHRKVHLPLAPYTAMAQGVLSKIAAGVPLSPALKRQWGTPENEAIAARARVLAEKKGMTVAQIAQCFFYAQDFPVAPVMSFSSIAQLEEAAQAADLSLTAAEADWLQHGDIHNQ